MLVFIRKSLFLFLLSVNASFGFSISPMYLDMEPSGSKARTTVVVSNSSPRPMPVKASISELTLDINGKAQSTLNTTDFVIFPQQAVLPPHGRQTFRVQWRNQPVLPKSKTYELLVSQVAAKDKRPEVDESEVTMTLQISLAFGSIINMRASNGAPKPTVRSSKLTSKSGKPALETVITNNGNRSFLLAEADSTVTVMGSGNKKIWSHTYLSGHMLKSFGLGLVQPNKSRRMKIPLSNLPERIARQAKSVKLEIRPSAK